MRRWLAVILIAVALAACTRIVVLMPGSDAGSGGDGNKVFPDAPMFSPDAHIVDGNGTFDAGGVD